MSLSMYFILYMIYSFIGWIIDVIDIRVETKKWVNRGFLIGPYCPIYGWAAIFMTILLKKYHNDPIVLFFMSMVICATVEYLTSLVMEKIFKTRWWDYSNKRFNINGRICLETMIPFGLLGVLLAYVLNPFFIGILSKLPSNITNIIAIILLVIFLVDNIISYSIITKINISASKLKVDNTEEITKKIRNYIKNYSSFGKRLINSFPNVKFLRKNKKQR